MYKKRQRRSLTFGGAAPPGPCRACRCIIPIIIISKETTIVIVVVVVIIVSVIVISIVIVIVVAAWPLPGVPVHSSRRGPDAT